jgi:hypothetical protein
MATGANHPGIGDRQAILGPFQVLEEARTVKEQHAGNACVSVEPSGVVND